MLLNTHQGNGSLYTRGRAKVLYIKDRFAILVTAVNYIKSKVILRTFDEVAEDPELEQ